MAKNTRANQVEFSVGRVMPYPHGTMSVLGNKTWLLSSRKTEKNLDVPVLVIEQRHAVGVIKLKAVGFKKIADLMTESRFEKHKHSRGEVDEWWSNFDELWVDEIEVLRKFKRPIPVEYPSEAMVWVSPESIKLLDVFEGYDWVKDWRTSWETGDWDLWAYQGLEADLSLDLTRVDDALMHIFLTEEPASQALKTVEDYEGWGEVNTDSLEVAFKILNDWGFGDDSIREEARAGVSRELKDRGVQISPAFEKIVFNYLPIAPESEATGNVLDIFKPGALLYKNAVLIVGSVAAKGHGNDLDILIKKEVPTEVAKRIAFRIGRACAQRRDVNFHIFQGEGPITSYIPLYDIALIPVALEKIEMQSSVDTYLVKRLEPMKPIRPETSSLAGALDLIESHGVKGFVQNKVDGIHVFFVVTRRDRKAFTEEGQDITQVVEEKLAKFPDGEYILDGELETWLDGKHQPRERTAGNVHAGISENLVITVFDCLFDEVDLRSTPFHKRLEALRRICADWEETMDAPESDLVLCPTEEVKTREELKEAIQEILKRKDKEGFVWKSHDGLYVPNRNSGYQVKWRRSTRINGIVLGVFETAVRGVFNYEWGIPAGEFPARRTKKLDGENYLLIGRTFSSKRVYNVGDPITVQAETINLILGDELDLTAWVPIVVEEA